MTASAGDAHDFCIYASRHRLVFPLLDADGDLVMGASTPDCERSIDMGTFADCSNEMTEIATSSGMYYLDLIATETTGKNVSVIAKSATSGMKTTPLVIPIIRLPTLRSGTAQAGGASTITLDSGASAKDNAYVGMYVQCSNNSPANVQGQTRKIISYVGSTKVATVEAAWGTNPSSATTYLILIPTTVNVNAWMGAETADPTNNGVPEVDVTHWLGTAAATPTVAGVPEVDVTHWIGTAAATPTVAGVPEVDVTHNAGSAITAASGRQEVNATHWLGSALAAVTTAGVPEVDVTFWRGQAVPATTQTGVPEVDVTFNNGVAITAASGRQEVNVSHWNGSAVATPSVAGVPEVDITHIGGSSPDIASQTSLTSAHSKLDTIDNFLDTEIAAILALLDTEIGAIMAKTDLIPGTQDGKTFAEAVLLMTSALLGKVSGMEANAPVFRSMDDAHDRITATTDADGNRSAVSYDTSSP